MTFSAVAVLAQSSVPFEGPAYSDKSFQVPPRIYQGIVRSHRFAGDTRLSGVHPILFEFVGEARHTAW